MIEEIKLLLPLLENVADGSMWLVSAYLSYHFVVLFTWVGFLGFFVSKAASLIRGIQGDSEKLREIMNATDSVYGNSYFDSGDVKKVLKQLKEGSNN